MSPTLNLHENPVGGLKIDQNGVKSHENGVDPIHLKPKLNDAPKNLSQSIEQATSSLNQASLTTTHDPSHVFDAVVPPIAQTSLFTFNDFDQALAFYRGETKHWYYSRIQNPTVRHFEEIIAKLEAAEDALAFGSGMAAISAVILTLAEPGDKIVAPKDVYVGSFKLFETVLKQYKIEVVYVDCLDLDAVDRALSDAKLFFIESPTSWTIDALEVKSLASLAHKHNVPIIIDNSWATPILQKPITLGVDIVIHTASKYIGGHSDVIAGVVAGKRNVLEKVKKFARTSIGGILSPFDAWLLIRGLRTLPVRIQAIGNSALELAKRFAGHPHVEEVKHPGLKALPEGLLGTSGLFSIILKEEVNIRTFINALRVFKIGISWGGHESLAFPASITREQAPSNTLTNCAILFDVNPRLIRLSIGLEGTEVLYEDLRQAIALAVEKSTLSHGV